MGARHERGRLGEEAAAVFFRDLGWEILDRNWRSGHGELDLVVRSAGTVAFVEVKTRSGGGAGDPLESITWRKRREVEKTSLAWLRERGRAVGGIRTVRFDAVAVDLVPGRRPSVRHLPDAWRIGDT